MAITENEARPLPAPPRRTYGWRSWGEVPRELLVAAALGIAVTLIESGGTKRAPDGETIIRNIIIVSVIFLAARLLETMLSWAIEQSRIPTAFRAVIYALGGWLGYFIALAITVGIWGPDDDDLAFGSYHFIYTLVVAAIGSVLTGLILHHNRKRNDRFLQTIARLKEHEFAEKELEIAREMQQRLMPPPLIERDGYRITARTEAAHIVGGDFFDVVRVGEDSTAVLVADVAGKGIAASLVMASCKAMIPLLASSGGAVEIMTRLNRTLCEQLARREFVAMIFALLRPSTGEMEIVDAGMPEPVLVRVDGTMHAIAFEGDRLPLGTRAANSYRATHVRVEPGDCLLMFSDGLPEAVAGGLPIGYERVEQIARSRMSVDAILDEIRAVPSIVIDDDVTLLTIERLR